MALTEPRELHKAPAATTGDAARVLSQAVLRTAELLGLSRAALARVLGVSEAGISRMASGTRLIDPASKEGELALLLVRLYRSLDALVGNDAAQRLLWLGSYNRGVNGKPVELIERAEGLAGLVAYLDGMRAPL